MHCLVEPVPGGTDGMVVCLIEWTRPALRVVLARPSSVDLL